MRIRLLRQLEEAAPTRDWDGIVERAHLHTFERHFDRVEDLAASLGVCSASLLALDVAVLRDGTAWFPMRRSHAHVCGIRTRSPEGQKRSVLESESGFFGPGDPLMTDWLVVVEGPTSAAAALTLGFDAIGRWSASFSERADMGALERCRGRDVVVIPDRDDAGLIGAAEFTRRVLVVARSVRVVLTPGGATDLRAAVVSGLTRDELRQAIRDAQPLRARMRWTP